MDKEEDERDVIKNSMQNLAFSNFYTIQNHISEKNLSRRVCTALNKKVIQLLMKIY